SISCASLLKETRAPFTTARSVASAPSSARKPLSRTWTTSSCNTPSVVVTESSLARLLVGASGFSYPSWRGGFYPEDARPEEFLARYAERLPTVELNATFYRMTSAEQFARWAAE